MNTIRRISHRRNTEQGKKRGLHLMLGIRISGIYQDNETAIKHLTQ